MDSYYLYQLYTKSGDQPFHPAYPIEYSIDGNGTMQKVIKTENDPNCHEVNPVIYQWVIVQGETMCSGTTKCQKEKQQRSEDLGITWTDTGEYRAGTPIEYDSTDCGYVEPQYRTVSGTPYCNGTRKVVDTYNEVSYDGGLTWEDTGVSGTTVLEYNSMDCVSGGTVVVTPNITITELTSGGSISVYDRGDGCMTFKARCYPDMYKKYVISVTDLNTFGFYTDFDYPPGGGVSFVIDVYAPDDLDMRQKWASQTTTTASEVNFLNLGGGTHDILIHIYQKGGGWDADFAVINFYCEYNTNNPTLTDNLPVQGWSKPIHPEYPYKTIPYTAELGYNNDLVLTLENCTRVDLTLYAEYGGTKSNYIEVMELDSDSVVLETTKTNEDRTNAFVKKRVSIDVPSGTHTIKVKNHSGNTNYPTLRKLIVNYFT